MNYRYTPDDVEFVLHLTKAGFKQKDINLAYHRLRFKQGTATEKGDYTNFISKLGKKSKKTDKFLTSVYSRHESENVIRKIVYYLHCSEREARSVYKKNIIPVCLQKFHSTNSVGLISIRYYACAANARLYFLFTTPNYAEAFGLDETTPHDDIWTLKTSYEWKDIVNGDLDINKIQQELNMASKGDYEPVLLNVAAQKY